MSGRDRIAAARLGIMHARNALERANALRALPARGGGSLPGRKPLAFAAWLFECLGMRPGDELVDLYPGTGVIGRAWASLSSMHRGNGGDRG